MVFMLCATITALCFTIVSGFGKIAAGTDWGTWFQVIWSIVLVVLAVILAVTAFKTLANQGKKKA
jgi:membrane protein implicated in regulation of membrane protease activity